MWDKIVTTVSESYPPFNEYLLTGFREEKVRGMLEYLSRHFQSMNLFNGALVYQGYHVLTPEERVMHMISGRYFGRGDIQIQRSTTVTVRFDFVYDNEVYSFFTEIPYMQNKAITVDGTNNYPLFIIMEKVLHRIKNGVLIQVARAPLKFFCSHQLTVKSTGGIVYRDFVPTTKLHYGKGGKARKAAQQTPILLYHLCVYGFNNTMVRYKLVPGTTIDLVTEPKNREGFVYFKVKENVYLEVLESELADKFKRRVVLSLMYIFYGYPHFEIKELYQPNNAHFKLALGQYTYAISHNNLALLYKNAEDHLQKNETMLDPASLYELAMIGFKCTDLNDLLFHAFYNLDSWMVYKPSNLYEKRLGSLGHMLDGMIRHIASEQFATMRNRIGLNHSTIARFMRRAAGGRWIGNSPVFRSSPEICNSNWLSSVGAFRIRSAASVEKVVSRSAGGHSGGRIGVPSLEEIKRTHPSNMVVEAIHVIPSSNPIVAGAINPYAEIDQDGNIKTPEVAKLVEHIFDAVIM